MSTQDAVTDAPKAAPEAAQGVVFAWIWLLASVVLAVISWLNGLQPSLAGALFAIAASPSFATFVLLPSINADWAAGLLLSTWLVSVTVLVAVTGGAFSMLTAGFLAPIAQGVWIRRAWIAEIGAATLLAYAIGAVVASDRGALDVDMGAWPQMMVIAYLAISAAMIASSPIGPSRAEIERRLAEVAHDLRTPLTHILGFAEMIERQVFGPLQAKYVEYAGLIRASGAHLLDFSNDMLDLARVDAGRYPLALERFDARDVVREVADAFAVSAQAKSIGLSCSLPESALTVFADRRALVRMLMNTLGNAVKFTPESGHVEVRASADGGALVLDTIDSGPGISASEKARLGQAFERGASGLGVEGAGLGLSLVLALAGLHGGRLSFHDAPGGGAIVRVTLPVLATE